MINKKLRVALVHDYIKEFGGAERVLRVLADMFPEAPIYTAFVKQGSSAAEEFQDREIIQWKHAWLIKHKNMHSPLRFLIPNIWESFDFSDYDLVISSASGYITKGIITSARTLHVCYCHTPPRFLYGYNTPSDWRRSGLVRMYGEMLIGRLRRYDYWAAQRPDILVVNSKEVKRRTTKFYRRDAQVIYPPVEVEKLHKLSAGLKKQNYYLIVARLVGTKGLELALEVQKKMGFDLKIVGESVGREWQGREDGNGVTWLGRVSDKELAKLYGEAKVFLALAQDEDFGMTVVEAMASETGVIAYNGGGYKETVVDGKTGVLFEDYSVKGLVEAFEKFGKMKIKQSDCYIQAKKFGREKFEEEILEVIDKGLRDM